MTRRVLVADARRRRMGEVPNQSFMLEPGQCRYSVAWYEVSRLIRLERAVPSTPDEEKEASLTRT